MNAEYYVALVSHWATLSKSKPIRLDCLQQLSDALWGLFTPSWSTGRTIQLCLKRLVPFLTCIFKLAKDKRTGHGLCAEPHQDELVLPRKEALSNPLKELS